MSLWPPFCSSFNLGNRNGRGQCDQTDRIKGAASRIILLSPGGLSASFSFGGLSVCQPPDLVVICQPADLLGVCQPLIRYLRILPQSHQSLKELKTDTGEGLCADVGDHKLPCYVLG